MASNRRSAAGSRTSGVGQQADIVRPRRPHRLRRPGRHANACRLDRARRAGGRAVVAAGAATGVGCQARIRGSQRATVASATLPCPEAPAQSARLGLWEGEFSGAVEVAGPDGVTLACRTAHRMPFAGRRARLQWALARRLGFVVGR